MDNHYEITIKIPKEMDSDTAKQKLENSIYKVAALFFETIGEHGKLTDGKKIFGNGHHKAQNIATEVGLQWKANIKNK